MQIEKGGDNMAEQWKKIHGYPNYKVSSNGRVSAESTSGTKQVKPYEKDNGYLYVDLYKNGQRTGNELAKEFMYWLLKLFFKSLAEMSLSITKTETGITIDYRT